MRLGVGLSVPGDDPEKIARAYVDAGYSAAVCPPVSLDQPERIRAVRQAFARHDVLLAEVGVWNNMLDPDLPHRAANVEANVQALALADEVGALCCVNIAGSFDPTNWDGPHPRNLSDEAFELTVQNVRRIVDAVKPKRTRYTLETMPWAIPDSADSYLRLIEAIDRPTFGVHLDPVNLVNCPSRYYDNAGLLRECFSKLGRWIVSCHGKDVVMHERLTVHLDEVRPGLGALDYRVFLQELSRLPGDVPLILEHLPQGEYAAAREYVVGVAAQMGLSLSPRAVSRRNFLILAAAGLLAGCRPTPQTTIPPTTQPTAPNPTPVSKMIACCGLICTDCPAFLATQTDDDAAKKTIAARWSAHYGMEFKPEDINCDGCLSEGGRLSGYCRNLCQVRPCARARGVENCAYCDDYACEKLTDFLAQVPQAKATLERVRKNIGQ